MLYQCEDLLVALGLSETMSDPNRMHWDHPDFYLKTREEMMALFGELEDAVNRPWEIAQRCHVKLEKVKDPFPRFDIPESETTDSYFAYVARQGFEKRRGRLEAMRAQGKLFQTTSTARATPATGPRAGQWRQRPGWLRGPGAGGRVLNGAIESLWRTQ